MLSLCDCCEAAVSVAYQLFASLLDQGVMGLGFVAGRCSTLLAANVVVCDHFMQLCKLHVWAVLQCVSFQCKEESRA